MKDGFISFSGDYFFFSEKALYSIRTNKEKIVKACEIAISRYYNKLAISKKNDSKELSLGLALKNVF